MIDNLFENIDLAVSLLGSAFVLLLLLFITSRDRFLKDYPPGPKGLPFVGVLPFLTSRPDKKLFVSLQSYIWPCYLSHQYFNHTRNFYHGGFWNIF